MTAVLLQCVNEVAARLSAIQGIKELEIMPSGDPAKFHALHIFYPGHDPSGEEPGATRYAANIEIVGFVENRDGAQAFADLAGLYAAAVASLLTEPPLGGIAETINEGSFRALTAPLANIRRLSFSLVLSLGFAAKRGDPAQPA